MIIGLVGNEGSGKDLIAGYMRKCYNFRQYCLADPIKNIAYEVFGWDKDKLYSKDKDQVDPITGIKPREFLKWLGTDIFQYEIHKKFPNLKISERCIWANCMKQYIEIHSHNSHIVISDVRFKHEANTILKAGGYLIYVDRINTNPSHTYEILELLNETNPDTDRQWIYDTIDNNGTYNELYKNVDSLLKNLKI